jgi:ABC-2 type transport system permease protein
MYALFRKELADHFDSVRFIIIFAVALFLAGISLYGALGGLQDAVSTEDGSTFVFLRLFTVSSGSIPSFASFIMLVGPLFGLILGFDSINGERNAGTLNRLLAQPIHRDDVINGKFLAGFTVVSIIVVSMALLVSGVGLLRMGIPPNGEEVVRLIVFLFFSIVYISFWLGLAILLSVVTRHAATSVLSVVAVWLIFALFISLIASGLAGVLYPPVTNELYIKSLEFQEQFSRISPSVLFSEATTTILNPTTRSLSIISLAEAYYSGGVAGVLPLGQSLLLVWPHLIGMLAQTLAAFVISYIIFMKQEIRGA